MSDAVAAPARDDVPIAEVADNVVALVRSFSRARARFVAAAEHNVEWSAQVILKVLHNSGPMRASALAECLHSDPSTVSRQVAALVKDGLLERRADPEDGRASILALTPRADAVLAEHHQLRLNHFAGMLSDWDDDELHQFARLLGRFTADFEAASSSYSSATATSAESSAPSEGNN